MALPPDYADQPERFRAAREATRRYATAGDTHEVVATRIVAEGLHPVLDIGCADGELRRALPARWPWVGVDVEPWDGTPIIAEAEALPVAGGSMGAAAALWVLYHLDDPAAAIAEARRTLRRGGLFATCTTARDDSPELLEHLPPQPVTTFDAEEAPDIVAEVFGDADVTRWDGPFVHLPDEDAVRQYLLGRGIGEELAGEVADRVPTPLDVTRRGVLVWARNA